MGKRALAVFARAAHGWSKKEPVLLLYKRNGPGKHAPPYMAALLVLSNIIGDVLFCGCCLLRFNTQKWDIYNPRNTDRFYALRTCEGVKNYTRTYILYVAIFRDLIQIPGERNQALFGILLGRCPIRDSIKWWRGLLGWAGKVPILIEFSTHLPRPRNIHHKNPPTNWTHQPTKFH